MTAQPAPAPSGPPSQADIAYLGLLDDILQNGVDRGDRTGTGTRGVFGRQLRFDLGQGFPLLTNKKLTEQRRAELTAEVRSVQRQRERALLDRADAGRALERTRAQMGL